MEVHLGQEGDDVEANVILGHGEVEEVEVDGEVMPRILGPGLSIPQGIYRSFGCKQSTDATLRLVYLPGDVVEVGLLYELPPIGLVASLHMASVSLR